MVYLGLVYEKICFFYVYLFIKDNKLKVDEN